jgi:hypothetical protein
MQLEPCGCQRGAAIISEGTADGTTIAPDHLGFGVVLGLHLAFNGTDAAYVLFECFFGVAIGFIDGLSGLTEIMKMTELVRHLGQGALDGFANGVLAIADDRYNGHPQGVFDLL